MGRNTSAGDLVRTSLSGAVEQLREHDVVAAAAIEPDTVHQARVAIRRLRSDLRTFSRLLEPSWVRSWRGELAVPARLLGAVRDVDVMALRLLQLGEQVDEPLTWLHEALGEQRRAALDAVAEEARGTSHRRRLDRLEREMADPPLVPEAAAPAGKVLGLVAARAWKPLRRAARRAIDDGVDEVPVEQLHAVRIHAKRFRYAAEAAGGIDPAARRHAKRLAALQDELGLLHDAAITERWLRDRQVDATADEAFLLGRLVERERLSMAALRRSWVPLWERADRPRQRRWMA